MYINTETLDYPLTLRQVKRLLPNVALPENPDEATLNALGFATVQPIERPVGDVVTRGQPEQREDGKWYQTWQVRDYTSEELEQQRLSSIPHAITPRQARLALLHAGLLSQVDTAIASLESPAKETAQIEWEYATSIERESEWINQLGSALGLDSAGIDDLFVEAASL
tara:strand:- start:159 stop:662 length:504 start_codon:yes stop_codon:yes gene_type:complete